MEESVKKYLAKIGRVGGVKSRRELTPEQARRMVAVREARRAYRKFRTSCFWSYDPELVITISDVPWVAEQLKQHGGREAWEIGMKLCR
ncbi:hypothetical protein MRY87_11985 [bacterium]|nr:hypothetical protein [bacterium]